MASHTDSAHLVGSNANSHHGSGSGFGGGPGGAARVQLFAIFGLQPEFELLRAVDAEPIFAKPKQRFGGQPVVVFQPIVRGQELESLVHTAVAHREQLQPQQQLQPILFLQSFGRSEQAHANLQLCESCGASAPRNVNASHNINASRDAQPDTPRHADADTQPIDHPYAQFPCLSPASARRHGADP
ncbi:MAG: hypothetical protein AMXMBFR13_48330 [Phycisphaerae bacterium]